VEGTREPLWIPDQQVFLLHLSCQHETQEVA